MAPTVTLITGSIFDARTGEKRTAGRLVIRLKSQMIAGTELVAPVPVNVDIPPDGDLAFTLVPSNGQAYIVEFDPDPEDTKTPLSRKEGYFKNEWLVPAVGPVAIETL